MRSVPDPAAQPLSPPSLFALATASARVQQSLRVLEEYGKTIDVEMAKEIEQLRYRCYTMAAELELRLARGEAAEFERLLALLRNQHWHEPGIADAVLGLMQRLQSAGAVPAAPAQAAEAAEAAVPEPASQIWTPESGTSGPEKKSAIWTPDD